MRFEHTTLEGPWIVDIDRREDQRGFFARTFCRDEFLAAGLPNVFVQSSISFNRRRGTLRGLHYQALPRPEAKLVRCTQGTIFDVCVDLRRASRTFGRWFGIELSAANRRALFIPVGFAHGFQVLSDETEVLYDISEAYVPELARGLGWNDPAIGVAWPIGDPILSEADRSRPPLSSISGLF